MSKEIFVAFATQKGGIGKSTVTAHADASTMRKDTMSPSPRRVQIAVALIMRRGIFLRYFLLCVCYVYAQQYGGVKSEDLLTTSF